MIRVGIALVLLSSSTAVFAEDLDYHVTDPDLKVVRLDSSVDDSFLSIRVDFEGRMFVGGRKTLYAYDPRPDGTYLPRRQLMEFPDHTWVNDIEVRGDDLYIVTVSAVYRLPDARVKREGLTIERLLWGVPNGHVHQCFHACAWGPEGDLYVSMGDPLWYYGDFTRPDHWGHWTMFYKPDPHLSPDRIHASRGTARPEQTVRIGDREWAKMTYNGVGAVFRIRPDGSRLQSFSRGLRNSCGLCFDEDYRLFTNDNDHEGLPSLYAPGRLLHVEHGSYFSWPRGWLQSKTPDRADLLPAINEEMGRAVPVLQTYYLQGQLPKKYNRSLMVARWCRRQVTYYPLEQASLESPIKAKEHVLLEGRDQARPVGICVGRDGRVFVTICYMAQNEGSPTYRSDVAVITRKDDPAEMPFEVYDPRNVDWKTLEATAINDARHRLAAVQEMHRRGQPPQLLPVSSPVPERGLLNQLSIPISRRIRNAAIGDDDWQQVLNRNVLVSEDSPAILHRRPINALAAAEIKSLTKVDGAGKSLLTEMLTSDVVSDRMFGVLAAGFRLTIPAVDATLPDKAPLSPQQKEEANIILFADEKVPLDLRKFGRVGNYSIAEHWKALPHTPEQELLFSLLNERLKDADSGVRLQAAHFLSLLNDPRSEPGIVRVIASVQDERLNLAKLEHLKPVVWTLGPVPDADGFKTVHPVETGPIDLSARYAIGGKSFEWVQSRITSPDRPLYDFRTMFGPSPSSSVYSFFRFDAPTAQRMQLLVGSEDGVRIWQNGKLVHDNDVARPLIQLDDVVTLSLQPGANDILVRVRMREGLGGQYFHYRHLGDVKLTIPDKPDGLSLTERLKSAGGNQPVDPKFLEVDWVVAVQSGDVARGRKLFAAESLGCAKCHAAAPGQAGGGGPSLTDSGKRFTVPYLVESVLAPSKVISPVFKSSILETTDGKVITGLIVAETAEQVEVLQPDTKRITILKSQIDARKLTDVSAMPQGIVKTPQELRDVLAYLMSNPSEP